jgi:hypothetical protein
MPRATGYAARAPALAIADFVRQRGAVYSTEILDRFAATLKMVNEDEARDEGLVIRAPALASSHS